MISCRMFITSVKRLHIALDPRAMNDGKNTAQTQQLHLYIYMILILMLCFFVMKYLGEGMAEEQERN